MKTYDKSKGQQQVDAVLNKKKDTEPAKPVTPAATDPTPDTKPSSREDRFIWKEGDLVIHKAKPSKK